MRLVCNYQNNMDERLSKPKSTQEVTEAERTSKNRVRVFKNSYPEMQLEHQRSFYGKNNGSP